MSLVAPLVIPALSTHSATLIFLHGRGDTGFGWKDTFEGELRHAHVKVVLPHAPTRRLRRFQGAAMPAWFDSPALAWDGRETAEHVDQARRVVFDLIRGELEQGVAPERILLGGFSQGAAVALFAGLTHHQRLGGIVALSGFLPLHQRFPSECQANRDTPVFLGCGDSDDVIPFKDMLQKTANFLADFQTNTQLHVYRNLQHSVSHQELDDVNDFILRCVPRNAT